MDWKRRQVLFVTALTVGALLVLAAPARAGDADELIREGIEMRRQGRDQDALEKFRRAHATSPSPRAQAQMGMAEQALGLWVDASEHMKAALSVAADPWIVKNRAVLEQAMGTIDRHIGALEVLGGPPGAEVRVEGRLIGTLPLGRQVSAATGTAAVEVRAPGYLPSSRSVIISAGELTRETIVLQKFATVTPPADRPPPSELPPPPQGGGPGWHGRAAWIAAGGAGLFAAGGVAALLVRESKAKWFTDPKNGCDSHLSGKGSPACDSAYGTGQTMSTLGIASLVTAGVLGAGAAVLFATRPAPAGEASTVTARLACTPALTGVGLACATSF